MTRNFKNQAVDGLEEERRSSLKKMKSFKFYKVNYRTNYRKMVGYRFTATDNLILGNDTSKIEHNE